MSKNSTPNPAEVNFTAEELSLIGMLFMKDLLIVKVALDSDDDISGEELFTILETIPTIESILEKVNPFAIAPPPEFQEK